MASPSPAAAGGPAAGSLSLLTPAERLRLGPPDSESALRTMPRRRAVTVTVTALSVPGRGRGSRKPVRTWPPTSTEGPARALRPGLRVIPYADKDRVLYSANLKVDINQRGVPLAQAAQAGFGPGQRAGRHASPLVAHAHVLARPSRCPLSESPRPPLPRSDSEYRTPISRRAARPSWSHPALQDRPPDSDEADSG